MQIQITGQGVEITNALRELTTKKIERTVAHMDKISNVHVTLKVNNENEQCASVNVTVPGSLINAHASSEDMYKTIDKLADNLNTQLQKYKEKHTKRRD